MPLLELANGVTVRVLPPDVPAVRVGPPAEVVRVEPPALPPVAAGELSSTVVTIPLTGPPGPPGPPGEPNGQLQLTVTAAAALSGHRAVTPLPDGTVDYASNTDPAHTHAPIWITLGAIGAGEQGPVLAYGSLTEPSWSWVPGPLYLGAGGLITQTPPTAPAAVFLASIGAAISTTTAFFDRSPSISII